VDLERANAVSLDDITCKAPSISWCCGLAKRILQVSEGLLDLNQGTLSGSIVCVCWSTAGSASTAFGVGVTSAFLKKTERKGRGVMNLSGV